jgi:two-component system OmpR family sensor kinase
MRHPWSLQRRLVVGIVALFALLSVAIGLSSAALLQHNLQQRLDDDLKGAVALTPSLFSGLPPGEYPTFLDLLQGQSQGSIALIVRNDEFEDGGYLAPRRQTRVLTPEQRDLLLSARPGDPPRSVTLGELGEYRIATQYVNREGTLRTVIAVPTAEIKGTIVQLSLIIALFTGAGVLAAMLLAGAVVRIALRPLGRVVSTAVRVSELPLSRGEVSLVDRVPPEDTDPRTEVGQVGAALNRLLDHVSSALNVRQRSERKVRQFVSDASHELRTPLTAIRGYAELTRLGPHHLPDDVRHSLSRIESESVRMTALVDELLLLARLDEGPTLDTKAVDLSRLVADAVSDAQAAGRDHTWRLDLPEEPIWVAGDRSQLHQVLANLLANARTHTPEGTEVLAAVGLAGDTAVVTVADSGPGIPEELQAHLFERFVRGDRSRSRKAGSTGLGLAIVHAIVDAHGGAVSVDSQPGRTVFRVELPTGGIHDFARRTSPAQEMPTPDRQSELRS